MKKTNVPDYDYYNLPELNDKVNIGDLNQNTENTANDLSALDAKLRTKAPIDSPKFSGNPVVPAPDGPTNQYERIASTNYVIRQLLVEEF